MLERFAAALAGATLLVAAPQVPPPPAAPQTDLDALMQQVLAKRDENWKKLQQYILDEREQIDLRGPSNAPLWGDRRDYTWFIRDGYFIRSPLKANGVTISEADRRKAEDEYLGRAKARDRRQADASQSPERVPLAAEQTPSDMGALIQQARQPEFIDSAYFLRFKFEQGQYAFVGHETFNGRDVLRIEYYPQHLFSHEEERQRQRQAAGKTDREKDVDAAVERMMNKVSLVTLWVEPAAHQIVKYTFDNVNFDFLPAAWLVRVSDAKASMTMSEPFPGVWLPENVDMHFSAMLAVGAFDVRYRLDYHDYREALATAHIKRLADRR